MPATLPSDSSEKSGPAGFLVIGFAMASTYQYPPLVAQVAADGAVAALGPEPGDAQIRHRHHQPAQILHLQPSVETHSVDGVQVEASPSIYLVHIKSLKNLLEFG